MCQDQSSHNLALFPPMAAQTRNFFAEQTSQRMIREIPNAI